MWILDQELSSSIVLRGEELVPLVHAAEGQKGSAFVVPTCAEMLKGSVLWVRQRRHGAAIRERIVRMVARKGSIVEVAGNSTGVINKPHPLLLLLVLHSSPP